MTYSPSPSKSSPLIVGEFAAGAFGPTILLKLLSEEAVQWLQKIFQELAEGSRISFSLASAAGVRIKGVAELVFEIADVRPTPSLSGPKKPVANSMFRWTQDKNGWTRSAALLEPFLTGRTGHQFLTDEGIDPVIIEVSYGEPRVAITP